MTVGDSLTIVFKDGTTTTIEASDIKEVVMPEDPSFDVYEVVNRKHTPGEILKAARLRANLTQVQVARAVETTDSMISHIEHDRKKVPTELGIKLSELLAFDPKYMIYEP